MTGPEHFAGTTRLAARSRTGGTLIYLLSDHIGSASVTTDANGEKTASALYKAFGETRYTLGNLSTDYKFTGQREEASLGIYFFNARWYDSSLGRFLSPDSIVPTSTQGTQAWDRYAFVNNNPVRYTDPTGHQVTNDDGGTKYSYEQTQYDRQRIAHEQCAAGDRNYCSSFHTTPENLKNDGGAVMALAAVVLAFSLIPALAPVAAPAGLVLGAIGGIMYLTGYIQEKYGSTPSPTATPVGTATPTATTTPWPTATPRPTTSSTPTPFQPPASHSHPRHNRNADCLSIRANVL